MNRLLLVFLLLALPAAAFAKDKPHIDTAGRECAECHADQESAWYGGKHGVMNVKCVVCHGSPEENFAAKPGVARCLGCHGEQVSQAMKKKTKVKNVCFSCHDNHTVTLKDAAKGKSGFHGKGGA